MADATSTRPGTDPDRASFTIAWQAARDQLIQAAGVIADTAIDLVGTIGRHVLANLLPAPPATRQPPHRQTRHLQVPGPRPPHRPHQLQSHHQHRHPRRRASWTANEGLQFRFGTLPGTDGPSGSTSLRSVGVIRPLDPRLSVIALWSLSETRCLRHPPPTTGRPAYVLITCLPRAPYGPSGRGSAPSSGTSLKPAALRRNLQHLVDRSFVSA